MSNKRSLKIRENSDVDSDFDLSPPSSKRRRLDTDDQQLDAVPSYLPIATKFDDPNDSKQFQRIFQCLQELALIPVDCINQEIAEYATGRFETCGNKNCGETISVLEQHLADYAFRSDRREYFQQIGFKFDMSSRYFCGECVHDVIFLHENQSHSGCDDSCDCAKSLHFKPNCKQCDSCGRITSDPDTNFQSFCHDHRTWCGGCQCAVCDAVICGDCWQLVRRRSGKCLECEASWVCSNCIVYPGEGDPGGCILVDSLFYWDGSRAGTPGLCKKCFDQEATRKCPKCNAECRQYHKSQETFYDGSNEVMRKCREWDCEEIVCLECDESKRQGAGYQVCPGCKHPKKTRVYCSKHMETSPNEPCFDCIVHRNRNISV